jgi:type VI secretion system protein VasG
VQLDAQLAADRERWAGEQALVADIQKLRAQLLGETTGAATTAEVAAPASTPASAPASTSSTATATASTATPASKKKSKSAAPTEIEISLHSKIDALRALQGESPMVAMQVDGHVVAEIVAAWTGVPLGKMVKDEIKTVLALRPALEERVIGQRHALEAIAQRVRTARAGLEDPNKPQGVFLFVGPSGVGKTETALALADALFGGERNCVTINMSEYQEAHSVSGLKGSPPGYVGYGEGGVLTEAVRRRPYSVVLLDEVEKAHPDVLELFFQVFDKGVLDDAEGREIDFRNTLIILTSNIGSAPLMQACLGKPGEPPPAEDQWPNAEALEAIVRPALYKAFKPAFLGRLKVVPFYPVGDDTLVKIIRLKLGRIQARVLANHRAAFEYDEALVEAVLARCTEVDSGARNVDHILNGTLLPEVANTVLSRMAEGEPIGKVKVTAGKDGQFKYKVT